MAAADARAGRRSERARRQRAGLDCFLHSTPDNTTASLSYAYILISFGGSSDESSREIIASCSHVIKFVAPEETIRARPQRIGAGPK